MFGRGSDRGRGHGRFIKREIGGGARGERGEETGSYHGYAQVFGEGYLSSKSSSESEDLARTKVKGKKKNCDIFCVID